MCSLWRLSEKVHITCTESAQNMLGVVVTSRPEGAGIQILVFWLLILWLLLCFHQRHWSVTIISFTVPSSWFLIITFLSWHMFWQRLSIQAASVTDADKPEGVLQAWERSGWALPVRRTRGACRWGLLQSQHRWISAEQSALSPEAETLGKQQSLVHSRETAHCCRQRILESCRERLSLMASQDLILMSASDELRQGNNSNWASG